MYRSAIFTFVAFCFASQTVAAWAAQAHLTFQSQTGDPIGQGKDLDITYSPSDIYFVSFVASNLPSREPTNLRFLLGDPSLTPSTFAMLTFATDQLGVPIAQGSYLDARRPVNEDVGHPGMEVVYQNQGVASLTGKFTITDLVFYRDSDNLYQVRTFAVSFEQHANGGRPALLGTFTYNSSAVPEPSALAVVAFALVPLMQRSRH